MRLACPYPALINYEVKRCSYSVTGPPSESKSDHVQAGERRPTIPSQGNLFIFQLLPSVLCSPFISPATKVQITFIHLISPHDCNRRQMFRCLSLAVSESGILTSNVSPQINSKNFCASSHRLR